MNNSINHMDWEPVVLHGLKSLKKDVSNVPKPQGIPYNSEHKRLISDDPSMPARVTGSLAKQIQTARIANGYKTQRDLAFAIKERVEVIAAYESGRAVPDGVVLQKLRRILKTKLSNNSK